MRSSLGIDSAIKASLQLALSMRLSPAGVDALKSGELARLLDPSALDKFRNPPAHSRYVDLATARECKSYVQRALEDLISKYTGTANDATSTIH
jgi:hypothetical protein